MLFASLSWCATLMLAGFAIAIDLIRANCMMNKTMSLNHVAHYFINMPTSRAYANRSMYSCNSLYSCCGVDRQTVPFHCYPPASRSTYVVAKLLSASHFLNDGLSENCLNSSI